MLINSAVFIAIVYAALVAFMYSQQRNLLYFPDRRHVTPKAAGLRNVEERTLTAADGNRFIVWYAAAPDGRPTILFTHGNAGAVHNRAERFAYYRQQKFGVLFISYRGYGGSEGSPTEQGLHADADAAYEMLRAEGVADSDIMLVGESLGSGVVIQLAARHRVGAIALEAPFTSAADVGASRYWFLPVRLLMKDQFRSVDHINRRGGIPLLIQHGEHDEVTAASFGERLHAMAAEPKELIIIKGAGHDISGETTWQREVALFNRTHGAGG